jgi:Zn-finger nucleic acid-binding protein
VQSMTQETNNNKLYKCPHCACIFLTQADLEKHLIFFSDQKERHEYEYKKIHDRMERGYGEE